MLSEDRLAQEMVALDEVLHQLLNIRDYTRKKRSLIVDAVEEGLKRSLK